jgi:tetratricopeptide (TPR) repeat protein
MTARLPKSLVATLLSLALASPAFSQNAPNSASAVRVWEQEVPIPTYLIGPPEVNPIFYTGGQSQGAQHRIYPYPAYDNLTTEKVDKPYKMVYLENEYIKLGILPESGGKIYEGIDKTNGYNFFYKNHVIKPALISLLGAWISGGVEWDIPHHHRATSFIPVQYKIEESPTGSKTVWVGELELRDRMRWAVGVTLHPGKSYLEASFKMVNRTPLPTSMLCFSNVAVHVDDTYQVIFPPSTQHVTYHHKRSFTTWPIATTPFNNVNFPPGTDVSWYKSHISSNSMFAWNYTEDFVAGYDHGKKAGTMSIADHNVVPGKKFWTWGTGPNGRLQDSLLTDSDGPYIELMVGAYSDNQPDYTWMQPYETRQWTQYWYPFREIGGVKNATTDAAVNLDVKDNKATLGFYATADYPRATVTLKLKDQVLLTEQIAISPARAFNKEITLPAGADPHDLRASLTVNDKELVAYSPIKLQPEAMPSDVENYPSPSEFKTNEELYLAGLRTEAFHAAGMNGPDPYWNEALRRDPGDIRVNTALAIRHIKAARYDQAEKCLRTALARATDRYTMPKDGEPFYYLGLALKAQGKPDEAFTQFSKSTWSAAWRGPGYFEMAQIASARGQRDAALTYLEDSLNANGNSTRALALKATLLRHAGRDKEALAVAEQILRIDPLDTRALGEAVASSRPIDMEAFLAKRRAALLVLKQFPAIGLEIATDYINAGLYADAFEGLKVAMDENMEPDNPLACYTMAYCAAKLGQKDEAARYYAQARKASTDYAFPFQMEMIPILEAAMAANPNDARAPYYLGNLVYDHQPERALSLWEKSASLNADFQTVYRNLAWAEFRKGPQADRAKTLSLLEKAAQHGGSAMVFAELDKLYEENAVAPDKRLAHFEQHQNAINRDEAIARHINLRIVAGKYDEAITQLRARFFRAWEGGGRFSMGDAWVNAHLLKGRDLLHAQKPQDALAAFQNALSFPPTLSEALGNANTARNTEVAYFTGLAHEALGNANAARDAFREAAEPPATPTAARGGRGNRGNPPATSPASTAPGNPGTPAPAGGGRGRGRGGAGRGGTPNGLAAGAALPQAATYFQALALQKLGDQQRANELLHQLADTPISPPGADLTAAQRAAVADLHCAAALGHFGLKDQKKALEEFGLALKAAPDHLRAKVEVRMINP